MTLWLSLPVHSGSLKRIDYPKQICLATLFLLKVFTALKGTHFYILLVDNEEMHNNLDVFKFGQIGPQITDLAVHEHLKYPI